MAWELNLKTLAYFEAVARLGRVSLAAQELNVSPAAVSQQLKILEEQYRIRLFWREKRRLVLTLDGEMLFQTTSSALKLIRGAQDAILRRGDAHNLTVRVSPSFGIHWLSPRLKSFLNQHPTYGLHVDATPQFTDFEVEAIDLDLRYGTGSWDALYSECLMRDFVLPLCSPSYLTEVRAGDAPAAEAISKARLLRCTKTLYQWDSWISHHKVPHPPEMRQLRFDRSTMVIDLARQGEGVMLEGVSLVLDDLLRRTLVPFLPEFPAVEFAAYWIVCPLRHMKRRTVRVFSEWLRNQAEEHHLRAREALDAFGCKYRPPGELELTFGE